MNYMQNRELSWLKFNERVMNEAKDETVPILERLRFLTIFTTNLDEFFRVRVGSLIDLSQAKKDYHDNKSGMTADEQLSAIYSAVRPLYSKRDAIYYELEHLLRSYGIARLSFAELSGEEQEWAEDYFQQNILPALSPEIIDAHHPFPHLQNKVINIACHLISRKGDKTLGLIPVNPAMPEVIYFPGSDVHFIAVEDLILEFADLVFENYDVMEKTEIVITRNADIHAEDEDFDISEDFRKVMKKMLVHRRRLSPVRLELSDAISSKFYDRLKDRFRLSDRQIFFSKAPLRLNYAYPVADKLSDQVHEKLTFTPYTPLIPKSIDANKSMCRQIEQHDILLSYPYESMDPFLRMLEEAAEDPDVLSIQITIYRLAGKSRLVHALTAAAQNGKEVTALVELRARFDEQNNIDWSTELDKSGCTVIYGIPGYKVHSKVCLITRHTQAGIRYLTQIGTGNYNEKTAKLYTDLSLLTADQEIGEDAKVFFQNMGIGNLYGEYDTLLVAPVCLKKKVLEYMDREIAKGSKGKIFFKINSLTDKKVIQKLHKASKAGVQVRMIIRGICCLIPGIPGETDNITVRSIVGRYLEHSRIYCFGEGDDEALFIASADMMTRNTERRVEVGVPIRDEAVAAKIHNIMDIMWADTIKARQLGPDSNYRKIEGEPLDAQDAQMRLAEKTGRAPRGLELGEEKETRHGRMLVKQEPYQISVSRLRSLWAQTIRLSFRALADRLRRLFHRNKKSGK